MIRLTVWWLLVIAGAVATAASGQVFAALFLLGAGWYLASSLRIGRR